MADKKCKTPGAWYLVRFDGSGKWNRGVEISVTFPKRVWPKLPPTQRKAAALEKQLHDAVEEVLQQFWSEQ